MSGGATLASVAGVRPGVGRETIGFSSRVVAVVLNWNAWADTIACVESLLASTHVPHQIVICDNGSRDDSIARLKQWGENRDGFVSFRNPEEALEGVHLAAPLVLIALPENGGYAHGNNIGIRYAIDRSNAEFVWILNNDTVAHGEALEKMLEVAESDRTIGIVGSKLLRFDQPDTIQAMGGGHIIPVLCHDTQLHSGQKEASVGTVPIALDHIVGASLLVRAEAVCAVGLIDESYFLYREETDWCIRMRRAGWKLYCCPKATVWHKQSHSIGFKSPLHDYYAVRNMLRLVWKFYPAAAPTAFGYFALRSMLPKLVRFEIARLVAVIHAFSDFFSGISGRSAHHTDQMLVTSYVAGTVTRTTWQPSPRAAGVVFALLVIGAVLWSGTSFISRSPQQTHRPIAAHRAAHPSRHVRDQALSRVNSDSSAHWVSLVDNR